MLTTAILSAYTHLFRSQGINVQDILKLKVREASWIVTARAHTTPVCCH